MFSERNVPRRLARRRRLRKLLEYRESERRRQQKRRARRASSGVGVRGEGAKATRMSRAGLSLETAEGMEVILEELDRAFERSRAGLHRQLVSLLRVSDPKLGQAGTRNRAGHAPATFSGSSAESAGEGNAKTAQLGRKVTGVPVA